MNILRAILDLPNRKNLLAWLAAVDFAGAVYGFYWYREQLMLTPVHLWPLVADSPLSALLFGLVLVFYLRGLRCGVLEAAAHFFMFKYGFWTVLVIGQYAVGRGSIDFQNAHLLLSHAGMALESVVFWRLAAPSRKFILPAFSWALLNDLVDYAGGLHPRLPHPPYLPWAAAFAFSLTLFTGLALALTSGRKPRRLLGWQA